MQNLIQQNYSQQEWYQLSQIAEIIVSRLKPISFEIVDESYKHQGHAGKPPGLSHLKLIIQSAAFDSLNILERHKMVANMVQEFYKDIHSISLQLYPSQR